jgi:hypothetical protein
MSLIITKQTGNFFSLVLDGGSPIISEQNRLTTFGNLCNFKTANGANLILKQNILVTEITVIASGTFTFTTTAQLWDKLIEVGFFDGVANSGSGSIIDRFDELVDTFSYIGRDGQVLIVNESQQKLDTQAITLFTSEDRTKLDGIEIEAQKNVQSDWNEANPESDSFIKNKPEANSIGIFSIRLAGSGQTYELPENAILIRGWINDAPQHLQSFGFESDLNTVSQSATTVTFKKVISLNQRIIIDYYI